MAELTPGRKVYIDSAVFKDFAIIEVMRFVGANFGQKWVAKIKCGQ